jgi:hypothetical protein
MNQGAAALGMNHHAGQRRRWEWIIAQGSGGIDLTWSFMDS